MDFKGAEIIIKKFFNELYSGIMRILIKLKSLKNCEYDLMYYNKGQGFIYNLIRDTEYSVLHEKKSYKYFCFSNIFPVGDIKNGEIRNFMVSSPDKLMIKILKEKLESKMEEKEIINIGEMSFSVENITAFDVKLSKNFKIFSSTPIIIRIPKVNFEKYGINSGKNYIFWRPEYSFEAFVKQLEENLIKKYNDFYKTKLEEFMIFEQFEYKKSVCNHVVIRGKEQKMVGSIWNFIFSYLNSKQKKLLEFGVDCGFGERNSFGFGFVNVVSRIDRCD